jgi:protein TonB
LEPLAKENIPERIYRLIAQILMGKDGCIEQVKIIDDPGYGLRVKVNRVISAYQQWIHAEMNGRTVRAYRKQAITFSVDKETKECEKERRLINSTL